MRDAVIIILELRILTDPALLYIVLRRLSVAFPPLHRRQYLPSPPLKKNLNHSGSPPSQLVPGFGEYCNNEESGSKAVR